MLPAVARDFVPVKLVIVLFKILLLNYFCRKLYYRRRKQKSNN